MSRDARYRPCVAPYANECTRGASARCERFTPCPVCNGTGMDPCEGPPPYTNRASTASARGSTWTPRLATRSFEWFGFFAATSPDR